MERRRDRSHDLFQVALIHFGRQTLDYATSDAARAVPTGNPPSGEKTMATLRKNRICPNLLMNFDCDKVVVNAYKVTQRNFDAVNNTGIYQFIDATAPTLRDDPAQGSVCLGGAGGHVFLDVSHDVPNFLGSLLTTIGGRPIWFRFSRRRAGTALRSLRPTTHRRTSRDACRPHIGRQALPTGAWRRDRSRLSSKAEPARGRNICRPRCR